MGFAIELYFDPETECAVREVRSALAGEGVRAVLDELGDRPHISLAVISQLDERALEPHLRQFAAAMTPFPITFDAVSSFPTGEGVLFLAPAASEELLRAHAALHRVLAELAIESLPYYTPAQWIPHCTVAQDVEAHMMPHTLETCRQSFRPMSGEALEVGLVSFRPVRSRYTFTLGPAADGGALDYEIASYQPSDQAELVRFFSEVLGGLGFDFDLEAKDADLRRIADVYEAEAGLFLLARRHGQVVGTIALRPTGGKSCELKRFYVRDIHRGNGLGTVLLSKAIAHARRAGWETIRLDTSSKSPAAISLFRKHGFVEISRYNDDPFAEVFMELRMP
jgi:GNAT superfamily N-acetyltransferase/2'-5' RNA ligase